MLCFMFRREKFVRKIVSQEKIIPSQVVIYLGDVKISYSAQMEIEWYV